MKPIRYDKSYIFGKSPENSVRFCIESRLRLIDEVGNNADYYQCSACKSEDTFAKKNLFYEDNYDFIPIFGPEFGMIFRRHAYLNQDYKTSLKSEDMWGGQIYKVEEAISVEELSSYDRIVLATQHGLPLVAQTEIWNKSTCRKAILEYPVKTMNISERNLIYQVDTGPVIFPDLSLSCTCATEAFSLAYAAFNTASFTDFIIESATSINDNGKEICKVYHYSKRISLKVNNTLYALT